MIQDIGLIAAEYAEDNEYYYLAEYTAGANQALDAFLLQDKPFALWYNILERCTGNVSGTARILSFNREVEFNIVTRSQTKDDYGYNYQPKVQDCLNRAIELCKYLAVKVGVKSFVIETALDQNDATLVGAKLTIITNDDPTTAC